MQPVHAIQTNIDRRIIYCIPENSDLEQSLNQPLFVGVVDQLGCIAGFQFI